MPAAIRSCLHDWRPPARSSGYRALRSCLHDPPRAASQLPDKRTGKIYTSVTFNTYSLPCFNELYELFYVNGVPFEEWDLKKPWYIFKENVPRIFSKAVVYF